MAAERGHCMDNIKNQIKELINTNKEIFADAFLNRYPLASEISESEKVLEFCIPLDCVNNAIENYDK